MKKQMKHKIYYSMESRRDLNEIWEYIASELQNTSAAERVVTDILDAVQQLEDFAELGAPLSSVADVEGGFRFLVTGNYLTFYRIKSSGGVYIDRILYGRRDYLRILFGTAGDK
ncbi:type II toxin-antitoxin system RelE/ParE family toxin [uncultured Oscillibacter sp.]|uniref:type II toxin-antitoxin system RelE/ParE family toxin n=1 Tax=uncultured Oscillibacter sp. TaxID=876091 RepID=UPI0026037BA0|nr:type II toxin-antitoxin system RelE/ParE family toxin [uncultured Oscillibacter sp.]